jgi:hypothetical protein
MAGPYYSRKENVNDEKEAHRRITRTRRGTLEKRRAPVRRRDRDVRRHHHVRVYPVQGVVAYRCWYLAARRRSAHREQRARGRPPPPAPVVVPDITVGQVIKALINVIEPLGDLTLDEFADAFNDGEEWRERALTAEAELGKIKAVLGWNHTTAGS